MKNSVRIWTIVIALSFFSFINAVNSVKQAEKKITLITLAPGHFHAALIQKKNIADMDTTVFVYSPSNSELKAHLNLVASYNTRSDNPTHWNEVVYTGDDYLEKMLQEKKGNVVILAGNNERKTEYIEQSVNAGLNVLADKPMAIDKASFLKLIQAYKTAAQNKVLVYDIMTERYDILNILQRLIMQDSDLFGVLLPGTREDPSVTMESIHAFYKVVSGKPLIRPAWYYDVAQQGEGIVDITTHLIDLAHWKCFPDISLDYKKDIRQIEATHWPTLITRNEFRNSTDLSDFPAYLNKYIKDSVLNVYSNGTVSYQVKGINIKLNVRWDFKTPEGSGDISKAIIKGSRATVMIIQDREQAFVPKLYIQKATDIKDEEFLKQLNRLIDNLQKNYPGITLSKIDERYEIMVPSKYKSDHESNFALIVKNYIAFVQQEKMPDWEIPNTITKYYITTTALEMAKKQNSQ